MKTFFDYLIIPFCFLCLAFLFFLLSRHKKKGDRPLRVAEKLVSAGLILFLIATLVVHILDGIFGSVLANAVPYYETIAMIIIIFVEFGLWFHFCKGQGFSFSKSNLIGAGLVLIILMGPVVSSVISSLPVQESWYFDLMGISSIEADGSTQKIALIDSGISEIQMDKLGKDISIEEISLVNNTDGIYDTNGHGSMMFYILNITTASDSDILSIRVMEDSESISPETLAEAIEMAIAEDCTVINLSLGSYKKSTLVMEAIQKALDQNITVVAAAGDYNDPDLLFPANMDGVISVGAITESGEVWVGTNAPNDCTILAPGENITTFRFGGNDPYDTEESSGTSQATALISGYVALLRDYAVKHEIPLDNEKIILLLEKVNRNELSYLEAFSNIS